MAKINCNVIAHKNRKLLLTVTSTPPWYSTENVLFNLHLETPTKVSDNIEETKRNILYKQYQEITIVRYYHVDRRIS